MGWLLYSVKDKVIREIAFRTKKEHLVDSLEYYKKLHPDTKLFMMETKDGKGNP